MTQKEVKKITLGGILSWIFGILFALAGLGAFTSSSYVAGFTMLIMGAVLLPPMNKLFKDKMNFELSKGIKIAVIIIGFIIVGMTMNTDTTTTTQTDNSEPSTNEQLDTQKETPVQDNNQEIEQEPEEPVEQEVYYAGDRVEVGNFAYTINSYYTTDKIGQDLAGTFMGEKADGIFLVLDVTIENIAKESKTMWGSYIKVIDDQGRTFEHDTTAEIYLDESFSFEQMQPGLPKTGKVVFDVPEDIKGMLGISSDSMWSDEVKYVSWNKKE